MSKHDAVKAYFERDPGRCTDTLDFSGKIDQRRSASVKRTDLYQNSQKAWKK